MKVVKKTVWCGFFSLSLVAPAFAQIAVLDPVGQVQGMTQIQHAVEQITELKNQLEVAKQQYDMAQQQYSNLSGVTDIANLLPNELDQLASTLPDEWQDIYQDLKGSDGLSGGARNIFDDDQEEMSSRSLSEAEDMVRNQQSQQYAVDESLASEGYEAQLQRVEDLKTAVQELNTASTAKEVMDLEARMAMTQASIMVERNRYMLAEMLTRAQQERARVQAKEVHSRRFYGTSGTDNSIPDITRLYDGG